MVSWDEVAGATGFRINWTLIDDSIRSSGVRIQSGGALEDLYRYMLRFRLSGTVSRQYAVQVTSLQDNVPGGTSPVVTLATNCDDDDDNDDDDDDDDDDDTGTKCNSDKLHTEVAI